MSLFFTQEPDQLATMSQAQAEHICNSGGYRLYDDGLGDEEEEAIRRQNRPSPPRAPGSDMDSFDIEF